MALTAKPISTISFNTREFLLRKLDSFYSSGIFDDYRVIFHTGEPDHFTGEVAKDHAHVWISPNRRLDTVDLRLSFNEVDFAHPDIVEPLGCLPFRPSKQDHWLLYSLHDPIYLAAHDSDNDGDGKIEYFLEDILTPFPEQLRRDYNAALKNRYTKNQLMVMAVRDGLSPLDALVSLNVNPMSFNAVYNLAGMSHKFRRSTDV